MVHFPIRKCYQAGKIALLVALVIAVLTLFEQWRGGKRNAGASYTDPVIAEYERQILEDEARIIPGLGEGGVAAHLMGEEKKLGEESEKKLAINVYLSDRIPYNRTLKDFRNPACQRVVYDAELPSASVIIIFHNEPYSVIVRTLWSVVNSARRTNPWFKQANFVDQQTGRLTTLGYPGQDPDSPFVYLKEIVLVDDNSTLPELKGKLSHYIRTRLPPDLIRVLRLPDRIGLTRARLAGARFAAGSALVFLDAHCEVQTDWLRPLLAALTQRPTAVVVPIIDVIDTATFYYSVGDVNQFQVGGFTFMGHFTWTDVPEREKKRRGSDIAPTWSPTMAGGLFAINRDYFWELGAYDEQMAGWGGENLEMSFRIWQCGGTLETIPCSRVGHVFRAFHPYGLPASSDTHGINTARMAEVWMDEYAELFYLHRPDLRNNPRIGDVTHRRVLRDKLHCKSFQWYLDNVYREKFVPVRDVYGYGRFKNPSTQLCLDTLQREGDEVALGAYPCYPALQATQYFSLTNRGEIRDETNCASVQPSRVPPGESSREEARAVVLARCRGRGSDQRWERLHSGQLRHATSALCLTAPVTHGDVTARRCRPGLRTQIWDIDYNEDNHFRRESAEDDMTDEQYNRLSKLRVHRSNRRSRSLLSYPDTMVPDVPLYENTTLRRRAHKSKHHKRHGHKQKHNTKKRVKNKFIVKLVRTLMNGTDDHLEVDIHCKHKRLYPNNTFVRDLVTILNDNNIKVINNGRVFERNRVTDLSTSQSGKELNKMDIEPAGLKQPGSLTQPAGLIQSAVPHSLQHLYPAQAPRAHKKPKVPAELQPPTEPKRDPTQRGGGLEVENSPTGHHMSTPQREGDHDKKLIIEDFVQVNSEHTTPNIEMAIRRHKHTRKPHEHARARAHTRPRAHDTWTPRALTVPHQKSSQDSSEPARKEDDSEDLETPFEDDELEREDREEWTAGEARYRHDPHNSIGSGAPAPRDARPGYPPVIGNLLPDMSGSQSEVHAIPAGREQASVDTDVHYTKDELTAFEPRFIRARSNASVERAESSGEGAEPVTLVMRSNLSFNIGDELYNWRNKAEDIVNEFINELSIPTNYSEYDETRVEGITSSVRPRPTSPPSDVISEHSSSSSDSSGD